MGSEEGVVHAENVSFENAWNVLVKTCYLKKKKKSPVSYAYI